MYLTTEKGTGGQHHGLAVERQAHLGSGTNDFVAIQNQIIHCLLKDGKVGLVFKSFTYRSLVQHPVGLGPGGAHCGPLAGIEYAKLNPPPVSRRSHSPAQCIHLFDQMAFAQCHQ